MRYQSDRYYESVVDVYKHLYRNVTYNVRGIVIPYISAIVTSINGTIVNIALLNVTFYYVGLANTFVVTYSSLYSLRNICKIAINVKLLLPSPRKKC